MRLVDNVICEHRVILMDSSNIDNFLNSSMLPRPKLPVVSSIILLVKVANGQCIISGGFCKSINVKVQSTFFHPSLYLLDLAVYDIVLGIQWLETLDPII